MRLIAGIIMFISTTLSVVIFVIANSVLYYLIIVLVMIISFLLSKAIVQFHEREQIRVQSSRQKKATEESKMLHHLMHPYDLIDETDSEVND